jgi:hypothetical protein
VTADGEIGPEGVDTPMQSPEGILSESTADNAVTSDNVPLASDQGTLVLDPKKVGAHEQASGAALLVSVVDGITDSDDLSRESDPSASALGLGDELSRSESTGEVEVNDTGEAQVADLLADAPSLEAVPVSGQPHGDPSLRTEQQLEEPQSVYVSEPTQCPADLSSPDEPLLIAVVKEPQGKHHVKPEHCPEGSLEESQDRPTSVPIVLVHEEQQTTLNDKGASCEIDTADCSIQTDTATLTDHKTIGGSCSGYSIDVSQRKEIEDLKKQIV